MKDKELLTHLNNLSEIKPSASWKEANEKLLFSQINACSPASVKEGVFRTYFHIITSLSQPAMVVLLLLFIIGGVGVGFGVGKNTKPGDSLYIAKRINEKARSTFTFDEKKKVQLEIEFAKNRVREIAAVKADGGSEEVENLVSSFKRDIVVVKQRIEKIYKPIARSDEDQNENMVNLVMKDEIASEIESDKLAQVENEEGGDVLDLGHEEDEEMVIVHSANSDKEEKGITVSSMVNSREVLIQVEEMVKNDDYESALKKLEEVEIVVDEDKEEIEVKVEEATSTDEVVVEEVINEEASSSDEIKE